MNSRDAVMARETRERGQWRGQRGSQSCGPRSARMRFVHAHGEEQPGEFDIALGELEALQGVVEFPVRITCAVLGWNTLAQALDSTPAA